MASSRVPPVRRDDQPADSQHVFDKLSSMAEQAFGPPDASAFVWQRKDGSLVGPFPALLATPDMGLAFIELNSKLAAIPGLPADAREVAILATGARFQAAYELYAHGHVAEKKAGVPREAVDAIVRGSGRPVGLSDHAEIAFDVATFLVRQPGPLSKDLWERSIGAFGRDGTLALVHYIGFYAYTCVVLNAINAPVPQPDE